jgi:hypothetical protein
MSTVKAALKELADATDLDVQNCTMGGVDHDFRPHLASTNHHLYWRCVWCHGITCGDHDEPDPCWLINKHEGCHSSRLGIRWPQGRLHP